MREIKITITAVIQNELKYYAKKLKHVLKTDGDKLLKNLLTNKIFSKQILSWNFKIEFSLNRRLVSEFLGWKLIILTTFFL